jgi:LacI family transcriptional regulator
VTVPDEGRKVTNRRKVRTREVGAVVTLKDIAKVAGVSAQTVSCVINNTGSVSDSVRKQIRQIATQLGYLPNKSAKTMRTGRSQTLGLVISDIRHPFFSELAHGVQLAAGEAGYALLFVNADGSPEEVSERLSVLRSHAVEGIIATEYSPAVRRLGLPTVKIGEPVRGVSSISANDAAGGVLLAEYLLAKGHRRIGLVSSPRGGCVLTRRDAFVERIAHHGEVAWEVFTPPSEVMTEQIATILSRKDVSAIHCSHDLIAIELLRELRKQKIAVPREISVVGFDDISWASIASPALTTVRQPFFGMCSGAIDLLLEKIANPARRTRHLKLGVELMERETVADLVGPP